MQGVFDPRARPWDRVTQDAVGLLIEGIGRERCMMLVTGAAGHLGNTLVRELLERGELCARCLPGEDSSCLAGLGVEIVRGNMLDPDPSSPPSRGRHRVPPGGDHLHPAGPRRAMRQVNVVGTGNVLRAAREARVGRLVYVSSIHALARPPRGEPIDEACPSTRTTRRGNTTGPRRRLPDRAAGGPRGLDAVIVCPTGIIGPFDYRGSEMGRLIRVPAARACT